MFFAEAWPAKFVRNTGDTTGQTGDSELASYKILAEGLQFPEGPVACRDGSVLLGEIERKIVTRVSPDGTTSIVAELDGGPNGLAVGPDGCLYICNNGGFLFQPVAG